MYVQSARYLTTTLLALTSSVILGQAWTVSAYGGQIRKHKEELFYTTPGFSGGFGVSYAFEIPSTSGWHQYWKQPEVSLSAYYLSFGDKQVLGEAYSIIPSMAFEVVKHKAISWDIGLGVGVGYLTKTFNRVTNPLNNAIGSHVNNATKIFSSIKYKASDRDQIGISGDIFHFSNGKSKSPNSGINVFVAELQYRRTLTSTMQTEADPIVVHKDFRKYGLDILYGVGLTQSKSTGGPTYQVHFVGVQGYRYLSSYIRILSGIEYEYNARRYQFFKDDFFTDDESRSKATDLIWTIGGEFFFGNYAGRTSIGYYLGYPNTDIDKPIYFKLSSQYYFLGRDNQVNPYLGLLLKSHFASAEYVALQVGLSW